MLLLALAFGLAGGLAGGVVVTVVDNDEAMSPVLPVPSVVSTPNAMPRGQNQLQGAITRVIPAVVTVIADQAPKRDQEGNIVQQRSVGSGVVIDERGHVITNFHVIDGAVEIQVLLATGEKRSAIVLAHDSPFSDLAVLEVSFEGLRVAELGDSALLKAGEPVAVITGAGFTSGNSVKVGVVSGLGRHWSRNGVILEDLVQTDAAVNQGDSGGALINLDGEVVGLLTTVVRSTPNGSAVQGVAFAQSSNSLKPIIEDIILLGSHLRPRLGIERPFRQHVELTPELSEKRNIQLPVGALVIAIEVGSPAEEAGVRLGDIVVAVNGIAIDLDHPFVNLLKILRAGELVELTVVRGSQQLSIPVLPTIE